MSVVLQCYGAARTVTGSRHLLRSRGARVLLECGLFQGRRRESIERNRHIPVLPLDGVILSHAHIDHSGALPVLVKDGYRGPIFATPATTDLARAMLKDSAELQVADVERLNRHREEGERPLEPIYGPAEVERALRQFRSVPIGKWFDVAPGVKAVFREAGHILGSAGVLLAFEEGPRVYFTGDLGRRAYPILKDPEHLPPCDAVISECTYGDRDHEEVGEAEAVVERVLARAVKERGKVFVPAFSVGRTQNLVYAVARRRAKGEFPEVPVFVDSPLAEEATRVFAGHPDLYDAELSAFAASGGRPFDPAGVQFLSRVEESRLLNDRPGPFVVIAGSGMCEGGRIVHHLRHGLSDPRNTVLFVGYAAPDTLARRILDGAAVVRMHGRDVPVRAAVEHIGALSAHADRKELLRFLEPAKAYGAEVILVHGDEDACLSFAETLRRRGHSRVRVPETYEEVPISKSREAAPPG